ncbi:MAG: DUF3427 domain-containing protein, partial [Myxococcales bacterium]|nr:DUF3427 domain-containing protein [Myxococcales bacterium]
HHAAAATYRKVLGHFRPRFLLGLTATPDRLDGASLLELCDDNLVYRANLIEGISRRLLVPFHYFGAKDVVDYEPIPWRGRFSAEALTAALETGARAEQALAEYLNKAPTLPRRTLAFCCSTAHADFMARFFRERGIAAAAVHSDATSAPRAESLRQLRAGELEIICAVDVFNEGLDVPDINVVLMLRPTESPVIFLQQLGRGLRRADDKTHLTVVDFIGNHRSFLQKPQGLVYLAGDELPAAVALARLREHALTLPEGCSVEIETEALDMLERLARVSKEDALLYEYVTFRDSHGRRPTAAELFSTGVSLRPAKERYGGWFELVQAQGDLTEEEARVLTRHAAWFRDLTNTKMTKAYKAVALQTLLDADALFEGMDVTDNAQRSHEAIARQPLLLAELREDTERHPFSTAAARKWREMPLRVWARGESTSEPWFRLEGDRFEPAYAVAEADREGFEAMTAELVELRLRDHLHKLQRKTPVGAGDAPIVLAVSHSGGRPILRFDRAVRSDTPSGETPVEVDGERYTFRFAKIAVNVVTAAGGGANVLPALMRGWFGPAAGQPGTHHTVELLRTNERWLLRRAESPALETAPGAEVIPFPKLPFYPDLEVACGAFGKGNPTVDAESALAVETERAVDAQRHFVVRASGDSMNGGDHPIQDGDLVLAEWWRGGAVTEVEGRPFLIVGHDAPDTTFAALKVPIRKPDGGWLLRSDNPAHADRALPAGAKVEPVARVLGVVKEATGLTLWGKYNRDAIARAFGHANNPSWQVGHRDVNVQGQPHTVLMVKLRKGSGTKPEHRYADRFLTPAEFQWESQASTKLESAKGRHITQHDAEGRRVHLFTRYDDRDDFVYCGTLHYLRHEGEQPMRVWWRLDVELPEGLWRLWKG